MKITNPYYARRSSGLPNGGGVSVPVRSNSGGIPGLDGIGNAIAATIGAATYDEKRDPRAQAARKYGLEADNLQDERDGRGGIADLFGSLDFSNPEAMGQAVREIGKRVLATGGNPDSISEVMRFMAANTPGTSDDTVGRAVVGAGGPARGSNTSYTTAGQAGIRAGNFAQEAIINDADNRQSGANTAATVAGAAANTAANNASRESIADADRYSQPVTLAPGHTAHPAPGDPRFPSGPTTADYKPADRAGATPPDVTPFTTADADRMEEAVLRAIPEGADIAPGAIEATVARAGEIYQKTKNSGTALSQAMKEILDITEPVEGWFSDTPAAVTQREAPTTPPKPGAISPAENKKRFPNAPAIGTKRGDYTYEGGDPASQSSWSTGAT